MQFKNGIGTSTVKGNRYTMYFLNQINSIIARDTNAKIIRDAYKYLAQSFEKSSDSEKFWFYLKRYKINYDKASNDFLNSFLSKSVVLKSIKVACREEDYYDLNSYYKWYEGKTSILELTNIALCYYYEESKRSVEIGLSTISSTEDYTNSNDNTIKELELLRDIIDNRIKELKGE